MPGAFGKKQRRQPNRRSDALNWGDLVAIGVIGAIGFFFLLPILVAPTAFFLTFLVAVGISFVGFVRGCMLAARHGNTVDIDYLADLGPLKWLIIVGFLGFYFLGYALFWAIAQIVAAGNRPKELLPWFGVQAYGIFLIVVGLFLATASEQYWSAIRNTNLGIADGQPVNVPTPHHPPWPEDPPKPGGPPKPAEPTKKEEPPPRLTGDAALDKTLADLDSKNGAVSRQAALSLADMKPMEQYRPAVAKKLATKLLAAAIHERTPLIRALGVWATADQVPVMVQMLADKDINTRNEILQVIGKLRDERTVKPVVRCFVEFQTTWHAERTLKELGPIAETEVLALLKQPNKNLWVPAIRVLQEIGTEQSIPTLQAATRSEITVQAPAQEAIKAINARIRK